MKNTRKLIPALAMLLVSAILMTTASFAWFSMNTTVTATGMQVTAKSNATFLLIGGSAEIATTKTGLGDTFAAVYQDTATNAEKKVYPVAYNATNEAITVGTALADQKSIGAGHWYTANNGNRDNANNAVKNVKDLNTSVNGNYVLAYKVWLTLSEDSEPYTDGKIKVTYSALTGDAATKIIVKIGEEMLALDAVNATKTMSANANLSSNGVTEVTVYVYIDGNSTNVKTDYVTGEDAQTITGTASVQFDLVDNT